MAICNKPGVPEYIFFLPVMWCICRGYAERHQRNCKLPVVPAEAVCTAAKQQGKLICEANMQQQQLQYQQPDTSVKDEQCNGLLTKGKAVHAVGKAAAAAAVAAATSGKAASASAAATHAPSWSYYKHAALVPAGPAGSPPVASSSNLKGLLTGGNAHAAAAAVVQTADAVSAAGSNAGQQHIDHIIQYLLDLRNNPQKAQEVQQAGCLANLSACVTAVTQDAVQPQQPIALVHNVDKEAAIRDTLQVLAEWQQATGQDLPFDVEELPQFVLNQQCVNASGPTQAGKSGVFAVTALIAAIAGIPCAGIVCETNTNTKDMTEKLQEQYFDAFNRTDTLQGKGIRLEATYPSTAAAARRLMNGPPLSRYQTGQLIPLVSFTETQIDRLTALVGFTKLPLVLVVDEADKFWSSPAGYSDSPAQRQLIQRERALYKLLGCISSQQSHPGAFPSATHLQPTPKPAEPSALPTEQSTTPPPTDGATAVIDAQTMQPCSPCTSDLHLQTGSVMLGLDSAPATAVTATKPALARPMRPNCVQAQSGSSSCTDTESLCSDSTDSEYMELESEETESDYSEYMCTESDSSELAATSSGTSGYDTNSGYEAESMTEILAPATTAAATTTADAEDTATVLTNRYPALFNLVTISATPMDMLAWHMVKQLPLRVLLLDREKMQQRGYVGPALLKPHEVDGQQVFLEHGDVSAINFYGLGAATMAKHSRTASISSVSSAAAADSLDSSSSSSSTESKVLGFYNSIAAAAARGQHGILVTDITCPRVNVADNNMFDRAAYLAMRHPAFVFLVVEAKGVSEMRAVPDGAAGWELQKTLAAGFTLTAQSALRKRTHAAVAAAAARSTPEGLQPEGSDTRRAYAAGNAVAGQPAAAPAAAAALGPTINNDINETEPDMEVACKLQTVIAKYDNKLHMPLVVIGYGMIRRSLSVRSSRRVVSHTICAPARGISLADVLQMVGRAMGNNLPVLQQHGFEHVTVLCLREDYDAMQLYYECVEHLYRKRATGGITDLIRTLEDVPAKYRSIFEHKRRQGTHAINSGHLLGSKNKYKVFEDGEGAAEAGGAEAAAAGIKRRRRGASGRLYDRLHKTIMAFAKASMLLKKQQLSHDDLRGVWPDALTAYLHTYGHHNCFYTLRKADPALLRLVRLGVQELTVAGRDYVQRFAAEVDDAF